MPPQSPPPVPSDGAPIADTASDSLNKLKREYLSLLPLEQIVELCLTLEPHVPVHVRNTIWPSDLQTTVTSLKSSAQHIPANRLATETRLPLEQSPKDVPLQQVHLQGSSINASGVPPMASLQDDTNSLSSQPPAPGYSTSRTSQDAGSSTTGPSTRPQSAAGTPGSQPSALPQPHTPYPYTYGYTPAKPPQEASYPHTPYYGAAHPGHPAHYPYGGYPPPTGYTSTSHGHPSYSPAGPPAHSGGVPEPPPPNPPYPPPPHAEDLPSYEEMIVGALMDTGDLEGAAPKDLFAWMAARYPLQTNFRPSASQALRKAYRRGRLEKRSGGRYRLNPSWEGGATSKRTTRKPQTLAQTTYAMQRPPQPPSSPFTNAPLHHRNHSPYPQASGHGPVHPGHYPDYSYGYPPGYPPYSAHGLPPFYAQYPPADKGTQPAAASPSSGPEGPFTTTVVQDAETTASAGGKDGTTKEHVADGHDANAWQAAQHILQAINFGSLHTMGGADDATNNRYVAMQVPSVVAAECVPAAVGIEQVVPRTALTEDERASLQAQLALLAAQLTEITNGGDEEEEDEEEEVAPVFPAPPPPVLTATENGLRLAEEGKAAVLDVNQFPEEFSAEAAGRAVALLLDNLDSAAKAVAQEEEESDGDEDMDMVEVPTYVGTDALQT